MIRVATYNIRKTIGTDRKRNPERVVDVIAELNADIVALQEADRRFGQRLSAIPEGLIEEAGYHIVPVAHRPGSIGWHGNALLVRHGATYARARALDIPTLEPRGAIMADIDIGKERLRVVGMHLDLSGMWRRKQLRAIIGHAHEEPDRPLVIMGDMNQWSDRGCLSEVAFHHLRLLDTPKSFHSRRPMAKLDRIIISHELKVGGTGVLASTKATMASDHLPIWAEIKSQ